MSRDGAIGYVQSPEAIAKTAAANRGRKLSPEAFANIAAANRAREHTPETRQYSLESREKMLKAALCREATRRAKAEAAARKLRGAA